MQIRINVGQVGEIEGNKTRKDCLLLQVLKKSMLTHQLCIWGQDMQNDTPAGNRSPHGEPWLIQNEGVGLAQIFL